MFTDLGKKFMWKKNYYVLKWYPRGIPWRSSGQDSTLSLLGPGSILGQETKIPQDMWHAIPSQKKEVPERGLSLTHP